VIDVEGIAFPVREDDVGPDAPDNARHLLQVVLAEDQRVVAAIEKLDGRPQNAGGLLSLGGADPFGLVDGFGAFARPVVVGFAMLTEGHIDHVGRAAALRSQGDRSARARAEVGCVGAEHQQIGLAHYAPDSVQWLRMEEWSERAAWLTIPPSE